MDEKTVIVGQTNPKPADGENQPAQPKADPSPEDSNATIIVPVRPPAGRDLGKAARSAGKAAAPAKGKAKPDEKPVQQPAIPPQRKVSVPVYGAMLVALLFLGFGSTLTSIYIFSPARNQQQATVSDSDLQANLVAVPSEGSEDEDARLIRDATKPRIFDLSGDPVIIPQLASAPRVLLKLASDTQRKAAGDLGIKGDVFRLSDVLDAPTPKAQLALLGSQDDIAVAQDALQRASSDDTGNEGGTDGAVGSSTVDASGPGPGDRVANFAQTAKASINLSDALKGLGLDAQQAITAGAAFGSFYSSQTLQSGDRYAVRAVPMDSDPNHLQPVQVSVYSKNDLVGSIALSEAGTYTESDDPWSQRDPFAAPLTPLKVNPEDQPRLLDAIYLAALRNRLPTPVIGETIMLLSRAQDLEQNVQEGDTITIIYSPAPRDTKQGLGRIVFVKINRKQAESLDCYVMQSQPGAQYQCVSSGGQASVPDNSMVTPVSGVIVARFGSQDSNGAAAGDNTNYGMDWTAPIGSPVVAAFDGQVTAIGNESEFGTVVRLSHDGGKTSMYGYLSRVETGLAVGSAVKAGQVIGYVGTPATSREPRLHFEVRQNGQAVDPVAEAQPNTGTNNAVDQFVGQIIHIESANRCNASNPLSTAVGLGQFIESTWMTTVKLHRPDLLVGHTRQEVLAMRTNCDLSRAMTAAFTRDNAAVVRQAGHAVTPGNLYLAHFLGVGGAVKVLGSQPNLLISDVFGAAHVRANPFEAGKTIGYLISWAAKKMGAAPSGGSAPSQDSGTGTATANNEPLAKFASDPVFAALKTTVTALLQ